MHRISQADYYFDWVVRRMKRWRKLDLEPELELKLAWNFDLDSLEQLRICLRDEGSN